MTPARLTIVVLGLLSTSISTSESVSTPAEFEIHRTAQRLLVRGSTDSAAHEMILRQTAQQSFDVPEMVFDLSTTGTTPPGWALTTALALEAIAQTRSASVSIDADTIRIHGMASQGDAWPNALERLAVALPEGMQLRHDVRVVASPESFEELCRRQFVAVTRDQNHPFNGSSHELPGTLYALLDAIAEIAADCPHAKIRITGHTDNSGSEEINIALSRARADAVANYLKARGIDGARLSAQGMGSSMPIYDNSNPSLRKLNRRIDYSVEFE